MTPTAAMVLSAPAPPRRYRIEVAIGTTAPDLAKTLAEINAETDRALRDELLGWLLIWLGQRHLSDAAIVRRDRRMRDAARARRAAKKETQ